MAVTKQQQAGSEPGTDPSEVNQTTSPVSWPVTNGLLQPEMCSETHFPIVGMGGCPEGFEAFFRAMPPDTGMAFVLVSHPDLSPATNLPQIIKQTAGMQVAQLTDNMNVVPNQVIIVPPRTGVLLSEDRTLYLHEMRKFPDPVFPMDGLFCLLAQTEGSNAIGIVLAHTGMDGMLGARAIKSEAGMVMVQEPHSNASHDILKNMVAGGVADFVLPPENMPQQLIDYVLHQQRLQATREKIDGNAAADSLGKIIALLRKATGCDFSLCKQDGILRHVEKRMYVHQIDAIDTYVRYLAESPIEKHALYRGILGDRVFAESAMEAERKRRQAEEALRVSESRYRELVQFANSAIIHWACDGTVLFFNEYAQTLFGYRADEIVGKNISLLVPDTDTTGGDLTGLLKDIVARPAHYTTNTNQNVCKDGRRLWISWTNRAISDAQSQVSAILSVGSDITEQKQMELERERLFAESRMANDRLSAHIEVMHHLHELGTLFLMDGNLESLLTKVVDAVIGVAKADFGNIQLLDPLTSTLKIAAHRGFPQAWIDFWDNVSEGQGACGTALALGERVVIEDVEQSPVFIRTKGLLVQRQVGIRAVLSTPLRSRTGRLIGMLSVHYKEPCQFAKRTLQLIDLFGHHAADIIDRAQAEATRHRNMERLTLALEAANAGMWERDLRTGKNYWSDELWKLYRRVPGSCDPSHETWLQTVHPDDRASVEQIARQAVQNGTDLNFEWRILDPDGTERWLLSRGKPELDRDGTVLRYHGIVLDITERKQAEESLRLSRARLDAAMASMTDAVFISDAEGRVIDFNDAFATFHKFKNKDGCAKTLAEYPAFLEVFMADGTLAPLEQWAVPRALRGETATNAEYTLRRKDTGEIWIGSYSFAPIRNSQDEIVGAVVVGRDITHSKEKELAEVRRLKDRYRAIVMDQNEMICRFDPLGRMTFVNDAYCRCFGVDSKEIIGENFLPHIHPDDLPLVADHFRNLSQLAPQKSIEHRVYLPDGSLHWQQWSGRALFDDKGRIYEYQAVGRDITELKEAEEKLLGEIRLRQLFLDALPCGALLIEHGTYRIVSANQAAVAAGAVIGGLCYASWMHRNSPCPWCLAPNLLTGGEILNDQFWNGDVFNNVYWVPVDENLYLHYSFDVTEEQKIREALEKAHNEMEKRVKERTLELEKSHAQLLHSEKLAAIGNLSASIAHEFNNPLQSVMTVLEGISRYASLQKKETQLVGLALQECSRMKNLIADLRDFYRPSSGEPGLVDLHATLDALLMICKTDFRNKKITTQKRYADNLPRIMGIPDQLKQVFLNLFSNAADACEAGGIIKIITETAGENVLVRIEDNGAGISPANLDRIFEPFFTTKPELKGTGLGLPVSYGIIKEHGGRIEVKSELGRGATFSVFLPRNRKNHEQQDNTAGR